MKAVIYRNYGPPAVLQIEKTEKPVLGDNDVLIAVKAVLVTTADSVFRQGKPLVARLFMGLFRPNKPVLGTELAGVVAATGKKVTRFRAGDEVMAATGAQCGAHAEYVRLPENGAIAPKPASLSFEEAATLCEALTGLPFLRDGGNIAPGQKVLINGASGSVGTFAVQLAKHFGAQVTAVCSTEKTKQVRELGADRVIDYKLTDFTRSSERYAIVFDAVGKSTFAKCKHLLQPKGRYLSTVPAPGLLLRALFTSRSSGKRAVFMATGLRPSLERAKDLEIIADLAGTGRLKPVVDRIYAFDEVAAAHAYVDTGRKKGGVVLSVDPLPVADS